jgi:hypothetical protein
MAMRGACSSDIHLAGSTHCRLARHRVGGRCFCSSQTNGSSMAELARRNAVRRPAKVHWRGSRVRLTEWYCGRAYARTIAKLLLPAPWRENQLFQGIAVDSQ